jgi:phage head maturation protease
MNKVFKYSINEGFSVSEVVDLKGEKNFYVEGYISTIDKDKSGEVIDYTAQQDIYTQVLNENITMDIEHEEWYDSEGNQLAKPKNEKIPVAKIVEARLDKQGVWAKAMLNKNLKSFSEIWGSIKDGFLKAFSIAFYPVSKMGNVIKSLNLVNVTLTGSPVNQNATFVATMKSANAWMDSQTKADQPTPANMSPSVTVTSPTVPSPPEIKTEERKENGYKCTKCDKEFSMQSEVDTHMVEAHKEETKEPEAKCKAEAPVQEKIDHESTFKAMEAEISKLKAEITSIAEEKGKLKAELESTNEEKSKLKAELEKPVIKAMASDVGKVQVEMKHNNVNPLGLLR